MTEEQTAAVEELRASMEGFIGALALCHTQGLSPAQAMHEIGIEIPRWANPVMHIVEKRLQDLVAEAAPATP